MNRSEILNACENYWNPMAGIFYKIMGKTVEDYSSGNYVVDEEGNRFLDFAGSYGVFLAGHNNPEIQKVFLDHLFKLSGCNNEYNFESKKILGEKLSNLLPKGLDGFLYGNSGAEIAELALRIAFACLPRRNKIVIAENSYHGKTLGALNILGQESHRHPFGPYKMKVLKGRYGDINSFKEIIDEGTSAVFIEPVLGGPYLQTPPKGFLKELKLLCDRFGVLLVMDEIQTGFGRTGKLFGIDHDFVVPDIMLLSKGMTGGFIPMAVLCCRTEILDRIKSENNFSHKYLGTTGGTPLACAVAAAAIDYINSEGLISAAEEKGRYLSERFDEIKERFGDLIIAVPGVGLMQGLKLRNATVESALTMELNKRKVHVGHSLNEKVRHPVLRFYPPLAISIEEIDNMLFHLEAALKSLNKKSVGFYDRLNILTKRQYQIPRIILKNIAAKNEKRHN